MFYFFIIMTYRPRPSGDNCAPGRRSSSHLPRRRRRWATDWPTADVWDPHRPGQRAAMG